MTDYTPEALEALRATVDVELAALQARNGINTTRLDLARLQFREALDDAYRTGQLIHAVPSNCAGCEGKPAPENNPCAVCGAKASQPSGDEVEAVAELQLAAFLAGRGSVVSMEHGTRTAKPAPTMDEFRQMARTALDAARGKQ